MNFVILFVRTLAVFEEKYKIKSPETLRFQDFFGPSGGSRTHGLMDPNHARYQLRYTRIQLYHYTVSGSGCQGILRKIPA